MAQPVSQQFLSAPTPQGAGCYTTSRQRRPLATLASTHAADSLTAPSSNTRRPLDGIVTRPSALLAAPARTPHHLFTSLRRHLLCCLIVNPLISSARLWLKDRTGMLHIKNTCNSIWYTEEAQENGLWMSMLILKSSLMNLELKLIFGGVSHIALSMMSNVQRIMTLSNFVLKQHERCQVET